MKIIAGVGIAVIILIASWFLLIHKAVAPVTSSTAATTTTLATNVVTDYKAATFMIDGKSLTINSSANGLKYFGNEVRGDLNGDGDADTAFLVTQSPGGSGTFYYVVVAVKAPTGYIGTNAVLLGDRIAQQTMQIENSELVVNYADRALTDPMTAKPSIGVTKYLHMVDGKLAEIPASEYAAGNLLLGSNSNTKLGKYLIGSNAMTLYVYAKDSANVSNCAGGCAAAWPPYTVPNVSVLTNLQAGVSGKVATITRAEGTLQVTYNGAPLYFFASDTKTGDVTGEGVGGVWSVAKP